MTRHHMIVPSVSRLCHRVLHAGNSRRPLLLFMFVRVRFMLVWCHISMLLCARMFISEPYEPYEVSYLCVPQEVLSPHLRPFLKAHASLLACDLVLSADGGQISEHQGGISLGLRGVLGAEVVVNTAATDMHSGMKGGSVPNPAAVLAALLAGLHDPMSGKVRVEGFYDVGVALTSKHMACLHDCTFATLAWLNCCVSGQCNAHTVLGTCSCC